MTSLACRACTACGHTCMMESSWHECAGGFCWKFDGLCSQWTSYASFVHMTTYTWSERTCKPHVMHFTNMAHMFANICTSNTKVLMGILSNVIVTHKAERFGKKKFSLSLLQLWFNMWFCFQGPPSIYFIFYKQKQMIDLYYSEHNINGGTVVD